MFSRALPFVKARVASSIRCHNLAIISQQMKYFSTETTKDSSSLNKPTTSSTFDDVFNFDGFDENDVSSEEGTDSETAIRQVFQEDVDVDSLEITIAKHRLRQLFGDTYMDDDFEKYLNKDSDSEESEVEEVIQRNVLTKAMSNSRNTPSFFDDRFADAKDLIKLAKEDEFSHVLDPRNPPRLSYDHVRMIKNIDYSPILARAQEGDQFTAGEVMSMMLMAPDNFSSYLAKTAPSRIPYRYQPPFLTSRTVDTLNEGQKACPLCKPDPTPEKRNRIHYTNVELLVRYLNERGQIISKHISGVCNKHQDRLRYTIKNARNLGLISSTSNWTVPTSYAYPEHYDATYDQLEAQDELVLMNIAKNIDTYREYVKFSNSNFAKKVENDPVLASEQRAYDSAQKAKKKTPTKGGKTKTATRRK